MNSELRILTFYVLLSGLSFATNAMADPYDYSRIIAFGDSMSDNGNWLQNTPPALPNMVNGRFSNGPTWIENVADPSKTGLAGSSMGIFWTGVGYAAPYNTGGTSQNVNLAVGGARSIGGGVPSTDTQITQFLAAGGSFGASDLVGFQIGTNDLGAFLTANPGGSTSVFAAGGTTIAQNAIANLTRIVAAGAKNILVVNLADVGQTPRYAGNPVASAQLAAAVEAYNATFDTSVEALASVNPSVNFVQLEFDKLMAFMKANAGAYGFSNVSQACFTGVACANPDSYLFWDPIHPSAAAHSYAGLYASLALSPELAAAMVDPIGQSVVASELFGTGLVSRKAASSETGFRVIAFGDSLALAGTTNRLAGDTSARGHSGWRNRCL